MAICNRCGAVEGDDPDALPAGWSLETTERGVGRLCLGCTRAHVRDIEAKLDEDWWGR